MVVVNLELSAEDIVLAGRDALFLGLGDSESVRRPSKFSGGRILESAGHNVAVLGFCGACGVLIKWMGAR